MRVEILTIGDELLLGFTIDTNAAHLARELATVGVEVARRGTVGDAAGEIAAAVREALERTGAVITTGGLGPTADDLTKPAIAALFRRRMRLDGEYLEALRRRWRDRFGGEMPESNRQQAMIPEGATIVPNRHGSAPGIWLEDERARWVVMLPGVPRELRGMTGDELLPRLRERARSATEATELPVVRSLTLRTTGIGESKLADLLGDDLGRGFSGGTLAYLPAFEGTDLRLTVRGLPDGAAVARLEEAAARIRARLGAYVYGQDGGDLAAVVLDRCRARRLQVAAGESCTGGLFAARLTAISGSSDVVLGGVVAYANDVKERLLGVPAELIAAHGAVSEEVARAMASGARARLGADIGVGITGIAGPGGGSAEKPVGTVWTAMDLAGVVQARRAVYVGDREEIRQRAAQGALDMIRRALMD